ncbi:hypothetical protein CC80DRAFT_539777 [Byssothecium circinans]|uniref:Uncharacterized protein n=1 Tax=Byssothecium circinans TaxID=147558 RepID=A0A6A5TD23_9PLEO|nr:hypothetical protein CC80DRAFT_539777 [Byssothecium circinans]
MATNSNADSTHVEVRDLLNPQHPSYHPSNEAHKMVLTYICYGQDDPEDWSSLPQAFIDAMSDEYLERCPLHLRPKNTHVDSNQEHATAASSQAMLAQSGDDAAIFKCPTCNEEFSTIPGLWDSDAPQDAIFEHVKNCLRGAYGMGTCPSCATFLPFNGSQPVLLSILHIVDGCDSSIYGTSAIETMQQGDYKFTNRYWLLWNPAEDGIKLSQLRKELETVDLSETCPLCSTYVKAMSVYERVDHYNKCWKQLGQRFTDSPRSRLEQAERPVTPISSSPQPLPPRPAIAVLDLPLPPNSCLFCHRDLSIYSDVKALHHRIICFRSQRDKNCPFCDTELDSDNFHSQMGLVASMWHLKNCQEGNPSNASSIQRIDFDELYKSWIGMMKMKRENGGVYQAGASRLKETVVVEEIEDEDMLDDLDDSNFDMF